LVIVETATGQYRVLSVYTKSYNKWRIETSASATEGTVINACAVEWDVVRQHVLKCNNTYVSIRGNEVTALYNVL
jgi:hypothetical protein